MRLSGQEISITYGPLRGQRICLMISFGKCVIEAEREPSDAIVLCPAFFRLFATMYAHRPPLPSCSNIYSSSWASMTVFFHLRAGTWRLNRMSISRYERPFISGTKK